MAQHQTLTIDPTETTPDTPTDVRYIGAGFSPNATLVLGLKGRTSAAYGTTSSDGTFDVVVSLPGLDAGQYQAYAEATDPNAPNPKSPYQTDTTGFRVR